MGREVRCVPQDWQHPKDTDGNYIPLFDGADFHRRFNDWQEAKVKWDQGLVHDYNNYPAVGWKPKPADAPDDFDDWDGPCPEPEDYMPDWTDIERTHYQMYETCTEGTPISPVMETPEGLARWLANNEASAFGGMTATYEQWLAMILGPGSSVSAYLSPETGLISGVEMCSVGAEEKR